MLYRCTVDLQVNAAVAEHLDTSAQRQNELETMQGLEDESVMNDVAAAEEDYDAPAQVSSIRPIDMDQLSNVLVQATK